MFVLQWLTPMYLHQQLLLTIVTTLASRLGPGVLRLLAQCRQIVNFFQHGELRSLRCKFTKSLTTIANLIVSQSLTIENAAKPKLALTIATGERNEIVYNTITFVNYECTIHAYLITT